MPPAEFENFNELEMAAPRGEFFETAFKKQKAEWAVIAIHGGNIEPQTDRIAVEIAKDIGSYYIFKGLKTAPESRALHLNSTVFDDPDAINVIENSISCLSIHGRRDRDDPLTIWVGGRDFEGRNRLNDCLNAAGFKSAVVDGELSGTNPDNICNRTITRMGIQIEVPKSVRDEIGNDDGRFTIFCDSCRRALTSEG